MLSATLGTTFNLRLAKALRSKVVMFVEGQDMSILRHFARTLSLPSLESGIGVTVIPLLGYSNRDQVEPFSWLCNELLPKALKTFVVLDRDYRPESVRLEVIAAFESAGIRGHVWERKELESYLLNVDVVARLSGAATPDLHKWLDSITKEMEGEVFGRLLDERIRVEVGASRHAVDVATAFKPEFDSHWLDPSFRLFACPPKKVISRLNGIMQAAGHRAVSMTALARAHRKAEIPSEVCKLLSEIDDTASSSR